MTIPLYNLEDTWNDGSITFTAIKMNITDTVSNAASLLMDLQINGTSLFAVGKGGPVISSPAVNEMALRINQLGYDDIGTIPIGSLDRGFNEIRIDEYSSVNVTKGFALTVTYLGDGGSNWGSSNALTEKVAGNFEARVFTPPTGSPGPHQPVGIAATARTAPGIGACPTVDLFAANLITIAGSPVANCVGIELDMDVGAGGSCVAKLGFHAATTGFNGTNGSDVAFVTGTDGVAAWQYGYSWFPNSIKGSILGADPGNTLSCINGIDFSNCTFSGSQIKLAMGANLTNAVNDAAAAGAGVPVGGVYRNGSILMARVA